VDDATTVDAGTMVEVSTSGSAPSSPPPQLASSTPATTATTNSFVPRSAHIGQGGYRS